MKKVLFTCIAVLLTALVFSAQTNAPGSKPGQMQYQKYVAPAENPQGCANILLYSDDPYNSPDFADVALQNLGCSYTGYYDENFSGFEAALTGGSWDLVIFADDNWWPPTSTFAALLAYVQGGGKLIYHSWVIDIPLMNALEVSYQNYASYTPIVYRWQPTHPIFNTTNAVPDLSDLASGITYGTYGYEVEPSGGGSAVAGYAALPTVNRSALVLGSSGNTIYQGWMDAIYDDSDGDGKKDQVELYENMIPGLCGGFAAVPISNWALVLGMVLIAVAVAFRYVRK